MIVDQSNQKCAHSSCSCQVPAGKAYCSEACEQAAAAPASMGSGAACSCGHATCRLDAGNEDAAPRGEGEMPRQF